MELLDKLKVSSTSVKPKIFIVNVNQRGVKRTFKTAAIDISSAFEKFYYIGGGGIKYQFTLADYVSHIELTVDEINDLFKKM